MTLSRQEVTAGIIEELGDFRELVLSLDDAEWSEPSRCEGWSVADVAAHVIGGMVDVAEGRLDGLGTPEVTARQVNERRARTRTELAEELSGVIKASTDLLALFDDEAWEAPAPGGYEGSLGRGVEALWYDAYLHADDMRAGIGRPSVRTPGLRASVHHVTFELAKLGWGPATVAVDGVEEIDVRGAGRRVSGDPLTFVLAATGRAPLASAGVEDLINIYA